MVDSPARQALSVPDRASSWWVAQIRPQYEEQAAEDMRRWAAKKELPLTAFVPREDYIRKYEETRCRCGHDLELHTDGMCRRCHCCNFEAKGRRTRTVTGSRPIFQGYAFYAGDRDLAFESPAVHGVLKTSPQDCHDIEQLYLASLVVPLHRAVRGIGPGIRVKVVAGPARGIEGFVEKFSDIRIYLRVGTLGGAEISTELRYIEPFYGD